MPPAIEQSLSVLRPKAAASALLVPFAALALLVSPAHAAHAANAADAADAANAADVTAAPADPGPAGRWVTESGNLTIEIAPCAEALCGTVIAVHANRSMAPQARGAQAATPPAKPGLQVLTALKPTSDGDLNGRIYHRENDQTYGVRLALDGPQTLVVRPYVAPGEFGPTQRWRRAGVEDRREAGSSRATEARP